MAIYMDYRTISVNHNDVEREVIALAVKQLAR